MSLRNIQYREDYRTGYDNLVEDFFAPSLRAANLYWRAVGYFSSSALESFGAPLGEFVGNNGRISLITSVELNESDIQAIETGRSKEQACAERIEQIIERDFADGVGDGVVRLARLLELNRLEIRIAVPKKGTGIYHEKIGLFFDDNNDFVAFTGSSNESRNAFENNRECIDVFTSWGREESRASRKKRHFKQLWNRKDQGVKVYSFPVAARKKLLKVCLKRKGPRSQYNKWRHQDEAIAKFLKHERGVLEMATGTGKTRTAIRIALELYKQEKISTVIVCAQNNDLLDQWWNILLSIRKEPTQNLKIYRQYRENKQWTSFMHNLQNSVLVTSRIYLSRILQNIDQDDAQRLFIVHDEVHEIGSFGNREALDGLSGKIRFRLGLSATPEREYDDEGNKFIEEHIGPVIMTFELNEAIKRGILCPFDYFPLSYTPTNDDREEIARIIRKYEAKRTHGEHFLESDKWIELARVYKTSEAKLPIFENFISNYRNLLNRCIIFVETQEYGESVLEIVHKYKPNFHTYYSGEDSETLKKFASGELECLITCHRLSQGIDVPSLNTVVLFSSARARLESIQRMGRCLRVNPSETSKIANVVDFIRDNQNINEDNSDQDRRNWLTILSEIRAI